MLRVPRLSLSHSRAVAKRLAAEAETKPFWNSGHFCLVTKLPYFLSLHSYYFALPPGPLYWAVNTRREGRNFARGLTLNQSQCLELACDVRAALPFLTADPMGDERPNHETSS